MYGGASTTVTSDASGDTSGLQTITVGLVPALVSAPVYLGIRKGFFAKQGLNVK